MWQNGTINLGNIIISDHKRPYKQENDNFLLFNN